LNSTIRQANSANNTACQVNAEFVTDYGRILDQAVAELAAYTNIKSDRLRSGWGWWIRKDWQSYQEKGLSRQARKMLIKAARYGNAPAQHVLGMMYANFERDEKALYWLNRAAAQHHANAKFA
jgi:TPR repeat protein